MSSINQSINQSILSNKERKKERILNPRGPHDGEGVPTRNIGIPIPQTEEWIGILKDYRQLAVQDDKSLAWVLRSALLEYQLYPKLLSAFSLILKP